MSVWDTNLKKYVMLFIGTPFRQEKFLAWIYAVIQSGILLFESLKTYRILQQEEASYNFQTANIQRMLNNKFDRILRRIVVTNANKLNQPIFFSTVAENEPIFFSTVAENDPVFVASFTQFITERTLIIQVPTEFSGLDLTIKRIINEVILAQITYEITYI